MSDETIDTLLIGIDAACAPILDPLFEKDALPNLEAIVEDGASGPLESQIPPWTASAWPSLYTGVNPGKHGVFGFLAYEGYDWDVVNATHVREAALWELLSHHDMSSVVVNVPVTAPPPEIDGAVVPGYTAPENPACHPDGLLSEVHEEIGEYRVYPDPEREQPGEYVDLVRMRGAAFRYLADRFEPEFGFVQFQQTDSVFHEHPDRQDYVEEIYRAVDEEIGTLLEECDPDTVVVASDHGMGPYEKYELRVNEFLDEKGYVETTTGGSGMPAWLPMLNSQLREGEEARAPSPGLAGRAIGAAARVGITPARAGKALRAAGLEGLVKRVVPADARRAGNEQVDFAESTAYMRSRIELGLRMNVEGREPEGKIPEPEYESVREEIIEVLSAVETPDGEAMFEAVGPREEYFWGPHADEGVDVVMVPNEFEQFLSADFKGEVFGPPTEPYNHKLDGMVAIAGEGVDSDADLSGAHLFDVAPTLCAALGVPRSDRMDGDVLGAVGPTDEYDYPEFDGTVRETDDEEIEDRLSALGYLEGNE
ncbi:alkaline phosphatase family protein [Halalkalicoccus salilacus]|uniref:alkaline phosphatase family protein n=1 Tax=Halalkalicoccus salilacus TaxID=3117459 RepID=UPI00300F297D